MSQKQKSQRQRRRGSDAPMPMGGAGLMRFYQDASNGFKIGPIVVVVLAILLIAVVIMADAKVFSFILG